MCLRLLKIAALVAAFVFLAPIIAALADEPIPRGLGHPPGGTHWYDLGCCSMEDCEPVEPGAITQTEEGYRVRYLTSRGFIADGVIPYNSSSIRQSQDGREHACASPARVLCIYLPMFM